MGSDLQAECDSFHHVRTTRGFLGNRKYLRSPFRGGLRQAPCVNLPEIGTKGLCIFGESPLTALLIPLMPIGNSAPISIDRLAPPTASCSLDSPHRRRTRPSTSLFRSTEGRRRPESCSSFESSEEAHSEFTIVVLCCLTKGSLAMLCVGALRPRWR
jgi:hypothetical protein